MAIDMNGHQSSCRLIKDECLRRQLETWATSLLARRQRSSTVTPGRSQKLLFNPVLEFQNAITRGGRSRGIGGNTNAQIS